jgi:predicted nucleotidyltransferase
MILHNDSLASTDFQNIFEGNLVAILCTGSISTNSYIEGLSDIDLIVVTEDKVSEGSLNALKEWSQMILHNDSLASGLDVSVVERKNVNFTSSEEKPEALEIFQGEIDYAKNALGNSPIVWDQILKNGIVVFGLNPQEIIATVPWEKIREALKGELTTIGERIDTYFEEIKFRYYVITTLCRMMYTIKTKSYISKEEALHWYQDNYGLHFEVTNAALSYIKSDKNSLVNIQKEDLKNFIYEVSVLL